ncbi:MAG: YHS domain-containing protein [Actinomycetota bacterium]
MWGRARDPVCKVKVGKKTPYRHKLNGRTYYFDSAACRQTFKENPQSFIGGGVNKNFIQELSSSSDGKRKTCH